MIRELGNGYYSYGQWFCSRRCLDSTKVELDGVGLARITSVPRKEHEEELECVDLNLE